jgi:hypothetical protein
MVAIALCYAPTCYSVGVRSSQTLARVREEKLKNLISMPKNLAEALQQAENLHASLGSRLSTYREQSGRLRPDFAKVYDELIERLGVLDRGKVGPKVGERMEDFILPDEQGNLVSLSSLLQSGPAVISFNRGHWWPPSMTRSGNWAHGSFRSCPTERRSPVSTRNRTHCRFRS